MSGVFCERGGGEQTQGGAWRSLTEGYVWGRGGQGGRDQRIIQSSSAFHSRKAFGNSLMSNLPSAPIRSVPRDLNRTDLGRAMSQVCEAVSSLSISQKRSAEKITLIPDLQELAVQFGGQNLSDLTSHFAKVFQQTTKIFAYVMVVISMLNTVDY